MICRRKPVKKDDYDENVMKEFHAFVNSLELDEKGYMVSYC